jgi:hypothetical protein
MAPLQYILDASLSALSVFLYTTQLSFKKTKRHYPPKYTKGADFTPYTNRALIVGPEKFGPTIESTVQ